MVGCERLFSRGGAKQIKKARNIEKRKKRTETKTKTVNTKTDY